MKRREKVLSRIKFRRFSTVQLLVVLGVFFIGAPFVEEIEGGDVIVSILFSLVLVSAVLAVAARKPVLIIAIALAIPGIAGRWDQSFPARPDSTCGLPHCRARPNWFCNRASARLYPACASG